MFPNDKFIASNVQEVAITCHSGQMSREDLASDILRCHYGVLSDSLQYPISMAQLLHEEGIITKMKSVIVKYTAESLSREKAVFLLLKTIRHAVHAKYHNLELFASVLLKFTSSVPCASGILKDCGECI